MKLKKIKEQFLRFLINVCTSGKYGRDEEFGKSDYLIRYVLMNSICIFSIVILLGFILIRLNEGKYDTVAACSVMILVALATVALLRSKKVSQIVPAVILMVSYALLCVMITWFGEAYGSNFLFIYIYPPLTIMMLGIRLGITFSLLLPTLVFVEMSVPGLSRFNYPAAIPIRMALTYGLVFFVMVVVEISRRAKDRQIQNQNQRLHELRQEADTANRTKSNFLANMSHEIRTPMNTITGMAELLLREDISDKARSYAQDIKQAGSNLISIINDILDLSKIEAGKLEIIPVKYLFSSLINDTINIIRMQLLEKPIRFFTNIDGNIPNHLIGDEVRLRQILLNLLSNAVKYSEKGHIGLTITMDKRDTEQVWLRIAITDTGKGIRPEDQIKLFDDFVQVDTKKNRNIEGTGLGLAITQRLSRTMGGDITVESEYGKGSTFTVTIPQDIGSPEPFAMVKDAANKKILVYEGRVNYAKSVCWSLENMKVPYTMVTNQDDFAAALYREKWFYVFSGYGLYEKIKPLMERPDTAFTGGRRPPLALMVEWGMEAYVHGVRFVSLPVQSLSISNTLNGKTDSKDYAESSATIRFTIPRARLLVVDDIATNLKIAEGLIAPYGAAVDTCISGLQSIELIKRREYDIVFMDHMMPEMDGIETTAAIRALEGERFRNVPIIALTANAVVGMREMFIENGFNDFLAKPIDVSKLDEILNRWIPKEKKEKGVAIKGNGSGNQEAWLASEEKPPEHKANGQKPQGVASLPAIPGVDTAKGISMTGGKLTAYTKILSLFCKDIRERLPLLQKTPEADTLPSFITQVHSLKGASASLGAGEISAKAAELEAAGKTSDMTIIRERLPAFVRQLTELAKNIHDAITPSGGEAGISADTNRNADLSSSTPIFRELTEALKSQNASEIERILEELNNIPLDIKTKETLEKISDDILITEFDSALEKIEEVLRT